MVKRANPRWKKLTVYILTLILSVAYILVARHMAMQGYPNWEDPATTSYRGKILSILSQEELENGQELMFSVKVLDGPEKGQTVTVRQTIYENY